MPEGGLVVTPGEGPFPMTLPFKSASLLGASLLMLGACVGAADAMPVSPMAAGTHAAAGVEPVAYLRRKNSRRTMRRNSPNKYCQSQPSRCH